MKLIDLPAYLPHRKTVIESHILSLENKISLTKQELMILEEELALWQTIRDGPDSLKAREIKE